jgi:uncharacterized protein (DUF1330 family)
VPALAATGGRLLVGRGRVESRENDFNEAVVIIEFDSFEAAVAAYDSEAYQEAMRLLGGGADSDIRFVEGLD